MNKITKHSDGFYIQIIQITDDGTVFWKPLNKDGTLGRLSWENKKYVFDCNLVL